MHFPWIFLVLASANEIRGYIVMSSLIGSAHTRSDPCSHTFQMKIFLFLVNRELSNQIQGYIHFKPNYITISNLLQASYFFIVACHIKPALEPTLPRFWNTIWRHKHSTALYVSYLFAGTIPHSAWWRHQMETFSALLAICAGNSPVPVNSPHKGQWRGTLMSSLICDRINGWGNNREAGDLRRQRAHHDVIIMGIGSYNGLGLNRRQAIS